MKKIILLFIGMTGYSCFAQSQIDSLVGFDEKHELGHISDHGIDSSKVDFYIDLAKRRYINKKYKLGIYAPPENFSSSSPLDCAADNWGFEDGNLGGWNQQGSVQIIGGGVDPYGFFPWVYPNGGNYSAKVSSDQYNPGNNDGRLDKVLNVPANGETLMSFHFAMSIFNYPHPASLAAKLWVEFYDAGGNILPCPQYECYYSTDNGAVGVDNFQETPQVTSFYNPSADGDCPSCYPVTYANWNTVTLDLSAYQGQQITAVFRVEWCFYDVDWGYVLLDVDCPLNTFEPTDVCLDQTGSEMLCGHDNMSSYSWTDPSGAVVGNNQCFDANISGTYVLESMPDDVECTSASLLTFDFNIDDPINITYLLSDYNGSNISCNGYNDGSIDINVSGGSPPYSYNWNTVNSDSLDQFNMYAGSYDLQITSAKGCVFDTTFLMIEPTLLQPTITATTDYNGFNISCYDYNDGAINVSVSGSVPGYNYLWNNGNTTQSINGLTSGLYTVDIIDSNLCTASAFFSLDEPTPLESTFIISEFNGYSICNQDQDGYIDLTVIGSVPNYSYQWSGGEITEDLDSLIAGVYSVIVTDLNGCVISDTIEITEPILNIQESVLDVTCFGGINGTVSVTVSGSTAPYYIFWDNNINTSLLSEGTYSYQIVDSIGCIYNDSLIVSESDSFFVVENITNVSCNGFNDGEVELDVSGATSPYIVDWFGISNTNMIAGTYNFTILDSDNCAYSQIAIVSEPNPIDVLNQVIDPTCGNTNDGSVSLVISGGNPVYSIDWGGNNPNALGVGTYEFVIIDDNNCIDSNFVTLNSQSNIQVISSVTEISCKSFCDGAIDLQINGGIAPYFVNWFGLNSVALCEGTVSYNLIDAVGCNSSDSFFIESPDSVKLIIDQTGMQLVANTIGGNAPYYYEWFNDLGFLANSQSVNITSSGNYYCIAFDSNHCQSDTVTYFYSETSTNDLEISNFNIYPNPTNDFLNIEFESINEQNYSIYLVDILGQKILLDRINNYKGDYTYRLDLIKFAQGIYMLELSSENKIYNKKIIKNKYYEIQSN